MPNYGGLTIFGSAVAMATADVPRQSQVNSYFGINGLETLDGGFRGRLTKVRGVLHGASALDLAAAENLFRSLNDGLTRTLVDNLGLIWLNVRLSTFQPLGRVRQSPNGTYFRAYQAQFFHLA